MTGAAVRGFYMLNEKSVISDNVAEGQRCSGDLNSSRLSGLKDASSGLNSVFRIVPTFHLQ